MKVFGITAFKYAACVASQAVNYEDLSDIWVHLDECPCLVLKSTVVNREVGIFVSQTLILC